MRDLYVPDIYQRQYKMAMTGKSRQAAIRVHCLMCMGWQLAEAPKCTAPNCPLFPYRMGTEGKDEEAIEKSSESPPTQPGGAPAASTA